MPDQNPPAPADPSPPSPAPSPEPVVAPAPPTLEDLAHVCEVAHAAYAAAKAQSQASDAKAESDRAAMAQAHGDLRASIAALTDAAKAEDPDPS